MIAALSLSLILILAAVTITMENRVTNLAKRVRVLEILSRGPRPVDNND